jgi:hypothetical protein
MSQVTMNVNGVTEVRAAKHTRGPWKQGDYILWPAHGGNAQWPVHAPKRGRIALALEKEADARLIASAPELLSALQLLYAEYEWDSGNPGRQETFAAVRAAIEKATGLAPVGVAE